MPEVNPHAMLLRVIAHDLLSPLTAIKWQAELMGQSAISREKRDSYAASIRSTAELGIVITKHAHVAGNVLTGTYAKDEASLVLSQVITSACASLRPQFERHGVGFEWAAADSGEMPLDQSLIGLLVWSIAKFFLASVPMNGAVHMKADVVTKDDGTSRYELVCGTCDAVEPEALVRMFSTLTARSALDQEYVFAFLIHEVARSLGNVSVSILYEQGVLTVRSNFSLERRVS